MEGYSQLLFSLTEAKQPIQKPIRNYVVKNKIKKKRLVFKC